MILPELPSRYEARRRIGEGAAGEVFLALDRHTGREVAMKIARANLAMHRRFRARFAREIALGAQVTHRHLVPTLDAGQLPDQRPYATMPFADQGNLRQLFQRGFNLAELLRLTEQVCMALGALHARSILHQDLKPENVLLHGEPRAVWVADLGVADDVSQLSRDARKVGGTPTYMAPEQLEGRGHELGPWTDLYALGLILFEAVAGRPPHPAEGRRQLLELRNNLPPPLIPQAGLSIPDGLDGVIQALLDPEPRQRYDKAADVRRALADLRADLPEDERLAARAVGDTHTELGFTDPVAKAIIVEHLGSRRDLRWNRVPPKALPPSPPAEEDAGLARSSMSMFALRELPSATRQVQRQELWEAAREVIAHREPRVVLVVGPEGTGRSTLVEGVARALDEGGWMEVATLRYDEVPGLDDGYLGAVRGLLMPWNDTRLKLQARLSRWLARDRELPQEAMHAEAVALSRWCGYLLPGERAPNAALGLSFLLRHLELRAWRGGGCIVMDDVHLAVEPGDGLAIPEALLEQAIGVRPLLILATVSASALESDPALRARVERLVERGARRIDLPPLTRDEGLKVLDQAVDLSPSLADELADRVDGQPLLGMLLLLECAEAGILVTDAEGKFALGEGLMLDQAVPEDPEQLLVRRLTTIAAKGPEAAEALAAMALAGQLPPTELIRLVNEPGLEDLLALGLIREEKGRLRFVQKALGRTAFGMAEELGDTVAMHARLAGAWAKIGEQTGADVDLQVGAHTLDAGQPAEAVQPLLRSTRSMLEQGRVKAALRAADLAIHAADLSIRPGNRALPVRTEARRLKAQALIELDDPQGAVRTIGEALALGRLDRLTSARLRVVQARAEIELNRPEAARELLKEAREAFTALQDRPGLADVAYARALLARADSDLENAAQAFQQAIRLRAPDDPSTVVAMNSLGVTLTHLGELTEARALVAEMARVANTTGDTRVVAHASYLGGIVRLVERRPDEADRMLQVCRANATLCGDHRLALNALNSLGEAARAQGDLEQARELYGRYARQAHDRGYTMLEAVGCVNLALIAVAHRDSATADREARRAAQALATQPRSWLWAYVGIVRALHAAESGEHARTRQWWALAIERGLPTLTREDLSPAMAALLRATSSHGWVELSAEVRAQLEG